MRAVLAVAGVLVLASVGNAAQRRAAASCPAGAASAAYRQRVERALRARRGVWGGALLASPQGPTYDGARRYLQPLLLARAAGRRPLTASGVHYVAFAQPLGARGAGSVALHVADGSQILSGRVAGPALMILAGRERYGSCLARLAPPRLADGYLPILETRYRDAGGARYEQESFAARRASALVSFVRLQVDARAAPARVGFATRRTRASYAVPLGTQRTFYVAWSRARPVRVDAATYERARQDVVDYWERRLAEGTVLEVPERHVLDAERNLLIQNLVQTFRYSIGNPYEEFSFPESVDVAQVMAEYGFGAVARSILRTSLTRRATPYPNWKRGEKLVGSALYFRLTRDRPFVEQTTPVLARYVSSLGRQIAASPRGLLQREQYSSDIRDPVYGLHSQAVVWQGLREIAGVWKQAGRPALAQQCRTLAARLGRGLRAAVRESERRLRDGSLFLPARLLAGERPYRSVTEARLGSYWNLVLPYALASGLFPPRSSQADGAWRYMQLHGSRTLGLVRAGAYALYGEPVYPSSGTDEVYGTNVARFLADNDRPDQLVLSLYGALAAGMTQGTFVSGEAASVAPLGGGAYRAMYLPPNAASNAAFLATLRLMLVHETRTAAGAPRGLELAYATPRAWLAPGKQIAVRSAPTSFGPLTYTVQAGERIVHAALDLPATPDVSLRLRLPRGSRLGDVRVDGRDYTDVDRATQTIDLGARAGHIEVDADYS